MVLVGSVGHLVWHGPNGRMALEPLHGPMCGPRFWASTWLLMATGPLGITAYLDYSRAKAPGMVLAETQAYIVP